MKRLGLIVSCAAAITVFTAPVPAQVFKPIDPTKLADVNGKNLQLGTADLKTIATDTREMGRASVSDKTAVLKGNAAGLKRLELQTLDLGNITKTNLLYQNFTAKRAVIADKAQLAKDLDSVRKTKVPIAKREIRPFTPGGEEELKKQLNTPQ
jgi:hypothetical protein